jgi:hypothetical protein
MTLKNAAAFAFIGTLLLTIFCAVGFIRDAMAYINGVLPAVTVLNSLVHLIATLSLAVFLYVFQKTQT